MKVHSSTVGDSGELTSLSERLGLMLVVRLFMAGVIIVGAFALPELPLTEFAIRVAALYAAVSVVVEILHRLLTKHTPQRWLVLVNMMLLIDGLFIAAVLSDSGTSRSVLIFLAYMHVVSVTLLVGFRTGLKIAAWHSMLLLTVYYLMLAGWLSQDQLLGTNTGTTTAGNELEVVQAIALWVVAIVTAVFSALNERELRRRKGELTIIADLSSKIEQTRRPSEILRALVEATTENLGATDAIAVCVHKSEIIIIGGNKVDVPRISDSASGTPETLESLGGLIAEAARTLEPTFKRQADPVDDKFVVDAMPDARNLAAVPLIAEGEPIAVLVTQWRGSRRRVTRPMIDLIANVAGRVALSLSNTFLLAEIHRLASVDGLTGLPNRRTFNTTLEREVARAARSGMPLSLVMLDIDHFKGVNDTHGHQMGDAVLAESAAGVMAACRDEDLPARFGGEEMAVIMPNCSAEVALQAAERIRRALGDANVMLPGVTASAGVATMPANGTNMTSLLAAADEALYKSKESGRNRTTASGKTHEATPTVVAGAHSSVG